MSTWRWRSYSCRTLNLPWQSCRGVRSRGRWGRQRHSHGGDPPDNFSVRTVRDPANRTRRERVGQQQQMPVLQLAPRASIAIAQFHKIYGAVELRTPAHGLDFAHAGVNLHKRAGAKQRVEGHILKPDVSVEAAANIEVLDEGDGNFAPNFDEAGKEIGVVDVEGGIEANGEGHGTLLVINFEIGEVGGGQRSGHLIAAEALQVNAVKEQEVGELDTVDGAETVELENAGNGIGVFDLREPCVGDVKLGITFGFGDLLAEVRHFTRGDAQTETNGFELFARGMSPSHAEVYLKTVKGRICNCHGIFVGRQTQCIWR